MHAFERTQYTLTIHTVQMYKHIKLVNNMPFGFLNSFFFVQKKKKKRMSTNNVLEDFCDSAMALKIYVPQVHLTMVNVNE